MTFAIPAAHALRRRRSWWPFYVRAFAVMAVVMALPVLFTRATYPLLAPQQVLALGLALMLEAREFPFEAPSPTLPCFAGAGA